jgi:hypothetical protein
MYPGGRPSDAARAIHRRFVDGPLPRLLPIACVLEVPGRRTGATIRLPLAIVPYRRHWYLVSMFGEQANWVRNVHAVGGEVRIVHGRRRAVRLVDVEVADRAPILRRYLLLARGARPHIDIDPRATLAEYERIAGRYPVFRVEARGPVSTWP